LTVTQGAGAVAVRPINEVRLIGGRTCLDFVNTVHDRFASQPEDYLSGARQYLAWAVRAGLLTPREALGIKRHGVRRGVVAEARRFREQLYALLVARIENAVPSGEAVNALGTWIHRAWRGLRFDGQAGGRLSWDASARDARLPLRRVALSAMDLLQHGAAGRLKRCAAVGECGWLFYDDTKNNKRRWCSMDTCGAIAKMRRYRRRQR